MFGLFWPFWTLQAPPGIFLHFYFESFCRFCPQMDCFRALPSIILHFSAFLKRIILQYSVFSATDYFVYTIWAPLSLYKSIIPTHGVAGDLRTCNRKRYPIIRRDLPTPPQRGHRLWEPEPSMAPLPYPSPETKFPRQVVGFRWFSLVLVSVCWFWSLPFLSTPRGQNSAMNCVKKGPPKSTQLQQHTLQHLRNINQNHTNINQNHQPNSNT